MSNRPTPRDDAWDAMVRGDYEVALTLYGAKVASEPNSVLDLNNKAYAALCLERYEEAREMLADVQRGYERVGGSHSGRTKLAVAIWLCGDRAEAIRTLETELSAIDRRDTRYLDDSFGVNEGEILYYFGAASSDQSIVDSACRYLERRNRKPLGRAWPPGLLDYLLDNASEEATRQTIRNGAVTPDASEYARSLLTPKAEMKFDFCRAIKLHARLGKGEAQSTYAEVSCRPNPILLDEWYLSRAEAGGD